MPDSTKQAQLARDVGSCRFRVRTCRGIFSDARFDLCDEFVRCRQYRAQQAIQLARRCAPTQTEDLSGSAARSGT